MEKYIITLISLFLSSYLIADIINVPADQPTIQQGIDSAMEGDTVLVDPGTYVENINFNGKNITVASFYLISPDTSYISQTIIDGDSLTSVVTFENGEDSTAVLIGFTITNGAGTELTWPGSGTCGGGIYITGASPTIKNLILINNNSTNGAGLYCSYSSNPIVDSVFITKNKSAQSAGGILCNSSGACFKNCRITKNTAKYGGGINCGDLSISDSVNRSNIYHNYALFGNDIYTSGIVNIILDTFSVLSPTDYHAYPPENITFDILNGKTEQQNADLYVSPNGDNLNSGLSADDPLKNIRNAFSKILVGENNPHTIFLADGTYSPSATGEVYPLNIPDYVSLFGQSQLGTILDGNMITPVFRMFNNTGSQIQFMTITNGLGGTQPTAGAPYFYAGGISCEDDSNPVLRNLSVSGNYGGISCVSNSSPTIDSLIIEGNVVSGLYLQWGCNSIVTNVTINENAGTGILCSSSDPVFENIIITNNASHGIWCIYASPVLKDIVIMNNSSPYGGGMHCYANSYPSLENVTIAYNSAEYKGGGIHCESNASPQFDSTNRCNIYMNEAPLGSDFYAEVQQEVIVDTFTVMYPSSYQTYPRHFYDLDILNAKTELIDADLYISPNGDNANSGLSEEDPLKNIESAFSMIMADANHQNTVHLMEGIYSATTTDEPFPVFMLDYVNLTGESKEGVILNAEGQSTVLSINNNISNYISNLTISGGDGNQLNQQNLAGGIDIWKSSVKLKDISVHDNTSGGISILYDSSPILENISIVNNGDVWRGGGVFIYGNGCNPVLKNVLIAGNQADDVGGGIYISSYADPSFINVTLTGNSATNGAGSIYSEGFNNPEIINSIIWDNNPPELYGSFVIDYSDIQGAYVGEGNLDLDPQFTGTGDHPFAISDQSPCINSGIPDTTGLILPEFDLAGNLRFRGARIDMGAYENQNVSTFVSHRAQTEEFELTCSPNPFSDELTINCILPESTYTKIEIFNSTGKRINELFSNLISEGKQTFKWNANNLLPGIYFIRMQTSVGTQTIRAIKKP